jgi:hypothetical protein
MSGNPDGDLLLVECRMLSFATNEYAAFCTLIKQLVVPNNHTSLKAKEGNIDD